MPHQTLLAEFESPIILMRPLQFPLIAMVNTKYEIYLYNTHEKTNERLLRLHISEEEKFFGAFDPVNMLFLFGTDRNSRLNLIDLNQKKLIRQFELEQQHPTAIGFDPSGSYVICGTDQGRVLLWRTKSRTLLARLHSFPDYSAVSAAKPVTNYVSSIAFQDHWVATSGYGGSVVITDYRSQKQTARINPGYVRNDALLFYQESLLVGNQSGIILKLDRDMKYPTHRLTTSMGPIDHLLRVGPEPYVLAVSQQRRFLLIDAQEMKILHERYIEVAAPLTALCEDEKKNLYIATLDGKLHYYDLEPTDRLKSLITYKEYANAYRFVQEEPILLKSDLYQTLESIFEKESESARSALEKGESEKAKSILKPFRPIKSKEINALFLAYTKMDRLTHLFREQKFSPFYGLCEQYPLLQKTSLYLQAEKIWADRFSRAQKMMLLGKEKDAREELQPFISVNIKGLFVQFLFQHFDILKLYSKALHERNYKTLKILSQRYPVIRKLPSYIQLISEGGELLPAITNALNEKTFELASLLLDELGEIEQYEEDFRRLKNFASLASNLDHAITNQKWRSAYQLLDTHRELAALPWGQQLETQWTKKLEECENRAMAGDISLVKKEFLHLITIPSRNERIGDIVRTAYRVQLRQILLKYPEKFGSGVNNYCDYFGMDTELRHLLKTAEKQGLHIELQPIQFKAKKRDEWLSHFRNLPDKIA